MAKVHALLRTAVVYEDRADPVTQAVTTREGETVKELCLRLLCPRSANYDLEVHVDDWIELRAEPEGHELRRGN